MQAKSNFSSVYLTNLQGTVSAMFTNVALGPVICQINGTGANIEGIIPLICMHLQAE